MAGCVLINVKSQHVVHARVSIISHNSMKLLELNIKHHGEAEEGNSCGFKNCKNYFKMRWCEEGVCADVKMVMVIYSYV